MSRFLSFLSISFVFPTTSTKQHTLSCWFYHASILPIISSFCKRATVGSACLTCPVFPGVSFSLFFFFSFHFVFFFFDGYFYVFSISFYFSIFLIFSSRLLEKICRKRSTARELIKRSENGWNSEYDQTKNRGAREERWKEGAMEGRGECEMPKISDSEIRSYTMVDAIDRGAGMEITGAQNTDYSVLVLVRYEEGPHLQRYVKSRFFLLPFTHRPLPRSCLSLRRLPLFVGTATGSFPWCAFSCLVYVPALV